MPDFKAKMHQIRFRLWLRLRPRWRSLQHSPRPPSCTKGGLLLREGKGWRWNGKKGKGEGEGEGVKGGRGRGKGKEKEGKGRNGREREFGIHNF